MFVLFFPESLLRLFVFLLFFPRLQHHHLFHHEDHDVAELSEWAIIADAPVAAAVPTSQVAEPQRIETDQAFSPAVIDAIARRAVELLSDKAVREIAWEVVPELAELLIKQKLEEQK